MKTKILIFGGTGMLGHKMFQRLSSKFDTSVTVRKDALGGYLSLGLAKENQVVVFDASDEGSLGTIIGVLKPDVVINCIGVIKQRKEASDPVMAISVNSLLPHRMNAECRETGAKLIHVSTDCVFSGKKGAYSESDSPDPGDMYGKSKLLGEVPEPGLTLRTSIIGREIYGTFGLVEWFLGQNLPVKGFKNAIYTGFTTLEFCRIVEDVISRNLDLKGLFHVSSQPISKFELLKIIKKEYGLSVEIMEDSDFHCDRSMVSDDFRRVTGHEPKGWERMISEMKADDGNYETWRRTCSLAKGS